LKHEKLKDRVRKGRCDPLGKLFARNGRDVNVGFSEALPPMLRLRKLVPFDSATSPLAPSVVVQLNVAAILEVDVK